MMMMKNKENLIKKVNEIKALIHDQIVMIQSNPELQFAVDHLTKIDVDMNDILVDLDFLEDLNYHDLNVLTRHCQRGMENFEILKMTVTFYLMSQREIEDPMKNKLIFGHD